MDMPFSKRFFDAAYMDSEELVVCWFLDFLMLVMILLLLSLILMGIESLFFSWTKTYQGKIIDKLYKSSQSSSGVGTGITTGGQVATVVTSSYSPEQWFVMVRNNETQKVDKVYCGTDYFYNHNIGDTIIYTAKQSKIRNKTLSEFKAHEQ